MAKRSDRGTKARRALLVAAAVAAASVAVATACAGSDDEATSGSADEPAAASGTEAPAADSDTEAPDAEDVAVATAQYQLGDYSISGPTELPAGTTMVSAVNNGAETHHLVFVRLENGADQSDFTAAFAKLDPSGVGTLVGGPTSVAAGSTGSATVVLEPGEYLITCFVPSPDGVPHFAKGMTAPLTVTPSDAPTGLPAADRTVRLGEFTIGRNGEDLDGFDGTGSVEVVNEGAQLHELALVRLADGASLDDLVDAASVPMGTPRPQPEPWTSVGGVSLLSPGESAEFDLDDLDLEDGRYAFVCFIPSPDDRVAHVAKGMTWEFDIPTD